jgi:glucose-6-phosphate 1-epimerase
VWNPWSEKSRAITDFADVEWTEMICVEACNVGPTEVRLAPGVTHEMTTTVEVLPFGSR